MKSKTVDALSVLLLMAMVLFGAVHAADATPSPDALVKGTSEEVLAVVKQTNDRRKLVQVAEAKVLPHFDFKRMTNLAVGRSWSKATPEQQQALEKEFRDLLVRTYANALAASKDPNAAIQMKPFRMQPESTEATVRTVVTGSGSHAVPIDYQMEKTAAGWKVYDVVVENVSLVTSYRESFAAEIKKSGIDGLIKTLAEKNKALADARLSQVVEQQ